MRKFTSLPYTEFEVADGNFDEERLPIDTIVIHTTVGTLAGAIATFGNKKAGTSAHYIVDLDGKLYAGLEEYWTAYHAGNLAVNRRSIGIEHVDNGKYTEPRTDALYETSSKLVADLCREYNIPCDRQHIRKHNEIVATGCPHNLDIDRIVRQASQLLTPAPAVDYKKLYEEKVALEAFLRGEIEKKDIQLQTLPAILAEKNSLAVQLDACQRDSNTYKEAYDKLPELQENVKYLEGLKSGWSDKEIGYQKRIKYLETRVEKLKTPLKGLLVEIWEAVKK